MATSGDFFKATDSGQLRFRFVAATCNTVTDGDSYRMKEAGANGQTRLRT